MQITRAEKVSSSKSEEVTALKFFQFVYLYSLFYESFKNGFGNGFNVLQLNNSWLCHIRYLVFFLSSSEKLAQFIDITAFGEKNLK